MNKKLLFIFIFLFIFTCFISAQNIWDDYQTLAETGVFLFDETDIDQLIIKSDFSIILETVTRNKNIPESFDVFDVNDKELKLNIENIESLVLNIFRDTKSPLSGIIVIEFAEPVLIYGITKIVRFWLLNDSHLNNGKLIIRDVYDILYKIPFDFAAISGDWNEVSIQIPPFIKQQNYFNEKNVGLLVIGLEFYINEALENTRIGIDCMNAITDLWSMWKDEDMVENDW